MKVHNNHANTVAGVAIAIAAIVFLSVGAGKAEAGSYKASTPKLDKLLMLEIGVEVAKAPNYGGNVCEGFGYGLATFFFRHHSTWAKTSTYGKMLRSAWRRASGKHPACNWFLSNTVQNSEYTLEFIPHLYGEYGRANYLKQLKHGLHKARCSVAQHAVLGALGTFPLAVRGASFLRSRLTEVIDVC